MLLSSRVDAMVVLPRWSTRRGKANANMRTDLAIPMLGAGVKRSTHTRGHVGILKPVLEYRYSYSAGRVRSCLCVATILSFDSRFGDGNSQSGPKSVAS